MSFKIAIGAGHSLYTAGKRTPDDEREWSFNDKIVVAFIKEMSKYEGVEIRRFDDPTGKIDVPLITRTNNANAWGADIYISVHHNASTGRWGNWTGTETYTQTGVGGKALELAKLVHPEIVKAYGLRDRGIKTANFHITRETRMPAILLENAFMDSRIDILKMRDDRVLANAGIGIANAVAKYANLKLKPIPTPQPKTEIKKQGGNRMLKLQDWQWRVIADVLRDQHKDGILSSPDWEVMARNKELSVDESILLIYATLGRNLDRLKGK